ncbi:MAG TPA: hypothetical protein VFS51_09880 [Gemmatimonadales bacterium]|nr:hypothetical protein [Gemmatimonadales bacterium]
MFIELTDHLRCPADHDESFLVLLPDQMDGRSVRSGQLSCPVCGRTYDLVNGVLEVGGGAAGQGGSALAADGLSTLVGLHGPGGYLVLVGPPAALWREVAELNPGVALVAVNPGVEVADVPGISVLRGSRLPLKSRAMRGVVLGRPFADDPHWVREAARVVLPGLRIVGEGQNPPPEVIDLLASADGVWVGSRRG